ncbi:MAG: hypothetical protein SFY67_18090 [Candidatus Melainabacteria bacterium]|nr:hypothetical protein [Candidatus Melainabacteria bacterium]
MDSWHSLTLFVNSENVLSSKKRLDQILDGTSWEHLNLDIKDIDEHSTLASDYHVQNTPALILHGNELDRVFHCLIDELPIKAALQGDFVQAIANEN